MAEEEARSTVALVVGALLPALTTVFFNGIPGAIGGSNLPRWGVRLPILLTCAVQLWFTLVSRVVPEPYLVCTLQRKSYLPLFEDVPS